MIVAYAGGDACQIDHEAGAGPSHSFGKVQTYQDPMVSGTFAIRATCENGGTADYLICGWEPGMDAAKLSELIEEVEWETWPPKSESRPTSWRVS